MEAARAQLRVLPATGEIPEGSPVTLADALDVIAERDARIERLVRENENIAKAAGKARGEVERLKGQLHKDLRLHKGYAAVQRLWDDVWKVAHPKAHEHPPEDWTKMGLARLKDFGEADLARALHAAINNPAVVDGVAYDGWDNALRSTGHVRRCLARATGPASLPRVQRDPRELRTPFDAMVVTLSAARRKFRRVEGAAGGLTNVMAWDEWRQRSSSTPRFVVSSSVARPA